MQGDEHARAWAELHLTATPGGFVGWWLRAMAAVARPLARAGVPPHAVTVAAMATGVAAVPLAAVDGWGHVAACGAVIVSGVLDALDGAIALQAQRTTRVGFLLDSSLDRLADAALPGALAIAADGYLGLAVAAVGCAWWLEYVRSRGALAGVTGNQVITPGERPTRMILAGVGLAITRLAVAALWAQVVVVGGSGLFLLGHSIVRLHRLDRRDRLDGRDRLDRP